jgi:mannose/cellobiose epimerase-like protein (N-acyl-D-glucosamine 2-epimerase family)
MNSALSGLQTRLAEEAVWAKSWLFDTALPRWATTGIDAAGFIEKIDLAGNPVEAPRRSLVQCRQIYAYSEAKKLGWTGPWHGAIQAGLNALERDCEAPDGTLVYSTGKGGDNRIDLYTLAFGLFAYANAYEALGNPAALKAKAERLLAWMHANLGHELGGFDETRPRTLPLRSNPHMHTFEALQAWMTVDPNGPWRATAATIANLCLTKFIHPETGALREYFAGDWSAMPDDTGKIAEPGHQYEWAWLLSRWSKASGDVAALAAGRRMLEFGLATGIDAKRGVPVHETWLDGSNKDPMARLWPNTERLKAALAFAALATTDDERAGCLSHALDACVALRSYLNVPIEGLWRDKLNADATWIDEPAPASSFYHLICGYAELIAAV